MENKRNAPDFSWKSIAEMFPPTKPGYTALLRLEKHCIQNPKNMESSQAYVGC